MWIRVKKSSAKYKIPSFLLLVNRVLRLRVAGWLTSSTCEIHAADEFFQRTLCYFFFTSFDRNRLVFPARSDQTYQIIHFPSSSPPRVCIINGHLPYRFQGWFQNSSILSRKIMTGAMRQELKNFAQRFAGWKPESTFEVSCKFKGARGGAILITGKQRRR